MGEFREPAQWPKVVGIISICWACFWLLCGGCGLAWMVAAPQFMAGAEKQFGEPFPDVMKPSTAQGIMAAVGLIVPIVLLIAGILTLRRRTTGRPMHITYAVLSFLNTAISAVVGVQQQLRIMDWAKHNQSSKWAQGQGAGYGIIFMAVFVALALAWPLFCVIWFGAMKRDPSADAPARVETI